MHLWAQVVLVVCAVVLTVVLVPALLALRRAGERAERLLAIAEMELGPLLGQVQGLADELGTFSKEARSEIVRVGALAERLLDATEGISRLLTALAGLTRAGQLVGIAAGLKTGVDVFLHRLRKPSGENHE
jgi:hypothetical protein